MKKLILSAVIAASLFSVHADKIKVASFIVADRAAVTQAANKIGELSCNMMLTGLLAGSLREVPSEVTEYAVMFEAGAEPEFEKLTNTTAKLDQNVLVKASVCGKGLVKLCETPEIAKELTEEQKQIIGEFAGASISIKVDDHGVSVEGEIKMVETSELAKKFVSGNPLAKDALAFVAKDVVYACAVTENGGADLAKIRPVLDILVKHGVETDKFLTVAGENGDCFVTLDVPALVAYIRAELAKNDSKRNEKFETLKKDLEALKDSSCLHATPAGKGSLAIKNYASPYTAQERFAATLSDYADKPVVNVCVWSYYAMCKAVLPQIDELKMFAANLPSEQKGGCASAIWATSPVSSAFVIRVSADEIKSFGLASGVVMSAMMSNQGGSFDEESADDEDAVEIDWDNDED